MAIRLRKDGTLICAAMSEPEEGDCYIDDYHTYALAVEREIIIADENHKENGLWHWAILVPPKQSEDEYMRVKPFAMGHCSKCEKYIPPTWMIWDGEPCPLCGEPFHSLPRTKIEDDKQ